MTEFFWVSRFLKVRFLKVSFSSPFQKIKKNLENLKALKFNHLSHGSTGKNTTKYIIVKNAFKNISFAMNFSGIYFVEELH